MRTQRPDLRTRYEAPVRQTRSAAGPLAVPALALALAAGLPVFAPAASAPAQVSMMSSDEAARVAQLKRETLAKLMRRVTIEIEEEPLENVIDFIENVGGLGLEVAYFDDRTGVGFEREEPITINVKDGTLLSMLERVLDRLSRSGNYGSSTWQFTTYGAFEVGPKEVLNRRRQTEIYDVRDLLFVIPRFDEAPEFDLNQIFQGGGGQGGGGGGQSPFEDQDQDGETLPYEERVEELIDLITSLVETEEWEINGGEGGRVREWRGNLIVTAPDYMHRQLVGYNWWPSTLQRATFTDGRRQIDFEPPRPARRARQIEGDSVPAAQPAAQPAARSGAEPSTQSDADAPGDAAGREPE